MDFLGLSPDDYAEDHTAYVWPCNVQAVNVFISASTQWRMGPGGPIGLDYSALPVVMEMMNVPRDKWHEIFDDLRILEDAAMEQIRKDQE